MIGALRQMEGGLPAAELCREHGMSSATLYKSWAKYGGMDASFITDMKTMAEEMRALAQLQRKSAQSASPPFESGWQLHVRRRSALSRAIAACTARHVARSAKFAKGAICASLPQVLTAASARAATAC